VLISHRIRIYPNRSQANLLQQACGVARYTYNWALAQARDHYINTGTSIDITELKKTWNKTKPEWVYLSPKDANQQPFTFLKKAYQYFFTKKSQHPKFKKRGCGDSFYISNDAFHINDRYVRLSKIGSVKMAEKLRFEGKIMSATVSRQADQWFVSIAVETNLEKKCGNESIGVDLGIKTLATLSTGETVKNNKPLKKNLEKLKTLQRKHSRKIKGSNNRKKSLMRLARLHLRISNQRKDTLHKLTTGLCARAKRITIEDLNVSGMMKNHRFAQAISDVGLGEFRRQLEYKSKIYGNEIVVADRWFPSSKTCSGCGKIKTELGLETRTYICDCGISIDRDLNAAINLNNYGGLHRK